MEIIRLAEAKDINQIVKLLHLLFEQEVEFTPNTELQSKGLLDIVSDANIGKVLVLEKDSEIIATVNILFTVSTALGARVAILEDFIVIPTHRGEGYGKQLMQAAIAESQKSDCQRITLLTDTDNVKAQAFYTKLGFESSSMVPYRRAL